MKPRKMLIALLLITCLLATPFFGACLVKSTYHYEINWGHLKRDNPNAYEAWEESYRCYTITNLFNYQTGWNSWNAYGSLTTKDNLHNTIAWRQNNDVFATDFWVGDYHPNNVLGWYLTEAWHWEWVWSEEFQTYILDWVYGPVLAQYENLTVRHHSYYGSGNDNSQDINDFDLYGWTNWPYSKQRFTFSWTCSCAEIFTDPQTSSDCYGYEDQQYYTDIVGMPLAWVSNTNMHLDGYGNPNNDLYYCYIGFDGPSHPLIDLVDGTNYHYTDFPRAFYEKLLGFEDYGVHQTVKDSLDHASQLIWGTNWVDSPFSPPPYGQGYSIYVPPPPGVPDDPPYGWWFNIHMRVFGDSAMVMPSG